jgi:hypothetical protein
LRHSTARDVVHIVREAALAALAAASGYLLVAVPNVELFTFAVFLSGVLLGPVPGARVGLLASAVFRILTPFGPPPLPLLVALLLGGVLVGVVGGLLRPVLFGVGRIPRTILLVGAGALCTLLTQALTNSAVALTIGQWKATLVGAIPFVLTNLLCNVVVFPVLGTACIEAAPHLPIPGLVPEPRERR